MNADQLSAQITRDQYADWETNYKPMEDEYLSWLMDEGRVQADVNRAGDMAGEQFGMAQGSADREMSRYGMQLTPEQMKAQERLRRFGASSAVAGARNRARGVVADQQLQGLGFMSRAMRDQAHAGGNMLSNAASMEAQRQANNQMASAQTQANNLNTLTSLGTAALFLWCSERYKQDIAPLDAGEALDVVRACDIQTYQYRDDSPVDGALKGRGMVGLIAEDAPDLLRADDKVNLANMVGVLMAANKALLERLENLERRIG